MHTQTQTDTSNISETDKFATYFNSVNTIRKKRQTEITQTELENYVAESLWRAYDSIRREASARLNTPEIDLGICNIKIAGMKVDNHKVVNAVGFSGRAVQITFMITVCKKNHAEDSAGYYGSYDVGVVKAFALGEKLKSNSLIYAESGEDRTSIFSSFSGKAFRITNCNWGIENAVSALGKVFASDDEEVNKLVYLRLAYGNVSAPISNKLQKTFLSSFKTLVNGLSKAVKGSAPASSGIPDVVLNASLLPEFIQKKNFIFGRKKAKMKQGDESITDREAVRFIKSKESIYEDLNEVARRRVRWLINTK